MISVITPTIRPDKLEIVAKALKKQKFTDFEWLIGSKEDPSYPNARHVKDDFTEGFWTLNRIYNKLFTEAKGELVVSLQDSIYIPPDGLQRFWEAYKAHPEAVVSGVGDQYEQLDSRGKPQIKIWADPRKTTQYGSFYECNWNDAEWNWCAIPKKTFWSVGGMDEQLDFLGYGGDQLQTCERMNDAGVHFWLDQGNESFTLQHDRSDFGGQEMWDSKHVLFNGVYQTRKAELMNEGQWPVLQSKNKPVIE